MGIKLTVACDYDEMSRITVSHIIEHINDDPMGLYCFAGGDTPVATLRLLTKAALAGIVDLSHAHFIELDEWLGIDERDSGSCISYLRSHFFETAGIGENQIHRFNPVAGNLEEECHRPMSLFRLTGVFSFALLGVGVNGHLGFNEPGSALEECAHVVELTEATRSVGTKYFAKADGSGRTAASQASRLASRSFSVLKNSSCRRMVARNVMPSRMRLRVFMTPFGPLAPFGHILTPTSSLIAKLCSRSCLQGGTYGLSDESHYADSCQNR